jgi:hypothetical protein
MCSVTVRTCTGDVLSSLVDPFAAHNLLRFSSRISSAGYWLAADERGSLGTSDFRTNLKAVGRAQPRLGFTFVFPLNDLAGRDQH